VVAITLNWTISSRQNVPSPNPFADYEGILPGQPRSALGAMRFSCNINDVSDQSEYCTRAPADGPFSLIGVTVSNGVINRVEFSLRASALTVGNMALLWGRPTIYFYQKSVNLEWPSLGVSASAWAESRRFSYFIPVIRLSFTRSF
jgi:hypothetical protein